MSTVYCHVYEYSFEWDAEGKSWGPQLQSGKYCLRGKEFNQVLVWRCQSRSICWRRVVSSSSMQATGQGKELECVQESKRAMVRPHLLELKLLNSIFPSDNWFADLSSYRLWSHSRLRRRRLVNRQPQKRESILPLTSLSSNREDGKCADHCCIIVRA